MFEHATRLLRSVQIDRIGERQQILTKLDGTLDVLPPSLGLQILRVLVSWGHGPRRLQLCEGELNFRHG